jgi:hypothetical protein
LSGSQTLGKPEHKRRLPPRDPRRLRVRLAAALASQLRGSAADAPPQALHSTAPGSPPREEAPSYWWADDRTLHEIHSERDYSLEETSGRTGESSADDPPARFDLEPIPEPGPKPICPSPVGPDPGRIRAVLDALNRDIERRRRYRMECRADEEACEPAQADGEKALHPGFAIQQETLTQRARQLLARYRRETSPSLRQEDVDPLQFAVWLHSLRPFLAGSSWRVYRNAALAAVQILPHENQSAAIGILAEDGRRRAIRARRVDERTVRKKDSGVGPTRARRIAYSDYKKLVRLLPTISRAPAMNWLHDWLIAGVSTGLLPAEWPLAELEERQLQGGERKIWLHVVNPAQRQEPNRLTYRTLDISGYQRETVEAIRRMVTNAEKWAIDGNIQQRRSDCAQMLYESCDVLFPTRKIKFSIFTLRHQFIANMKSLMNRAEVITMAGDVDIDDDSGHYAKRRAAWNNSDIKDVAVPIEEQIRQVSNTFGWLKIERA